MKNLILSLTAAIGLSVLLALPAAAGTITLDFSGDNVESSNDPATGASGSIIFDFSDEGGDVRVTLTITNTTDETSFGAGATEGQLTGFAFDLPTGATFIVGSFVSDTDGHFTDALEDVNFTPFSNRSDVGIFDLGIADNGNFGGGNANGALSEGDTAIVSFLVDTALSAADLMVAFMTGLLNGDLDAGLRFQQVNAGEGSDRLLFVPDVAEIPVPGAIWLMGAGLAGLGFASRKKKQA